MIFPTGGPEPRHPSQLYQAGLEGLLLLIVMHLAWRREEWRNRPGFLSGLFMVGYGVARFIGEFFRQPDDFLGYLWGGATMGQLLSLPLVLFGVFLMSRAKPA
jgi:phosphatidylglycerol:prolipoprotein diacylglycerol transferase